MGGSGSTKVQKKAKKSRRKESLASNATGSTKVRLQRGRPGGVGTT